MSYPILPSPKVSDVVVEPYNATLAINSLVQTVDECAVLDNEALYNICVQVLKKPNPRFNELNQLISAAMGGVTAGLRFPGQLNADLRKLGVNLVPFPKLHFFQIGLAPLTSREAAMYRKVSVATLANQMFQPLNLFAAADPRNGRFLTTAAIFRGRVSTRDVEEEMLKIQNKFSSYFVDWIPNNIKSSVCEVTPKVPPTDMSATFLSNNTAIKSIFQRIARQFNAMYRRKAFLHWYTGEGMHEAEFEEAIEQLQALIQDYQQFDTNNLDMEDNGEENDRFDIGDQQQYLDEYAVDPEEDTMRSDSLPDQLPSVLPQPFGSNIRMPTVRRPNSVNAVRSRADSRNEHSRRPESAGLIGYQYSASAGVVDLRGTRDDALLDTRYNAPLHRQSPVGNQNIVKEDDLYRTDYSHLGITGNGNEDRYGDNLYTTNVRQSGNTDIDDIYGINQYTQPRSGSQARHRDDDVLDLQYNTSIRPGSQARHRDQDVLDLSYTPTHVTDTRNGDGRQADQYNSQYITGRQGEQYNSHYNTEMGSIGGSVGGSKRYTSQYDIGGIGGGDKVDLDLDVNYLTEQYNKSMGLYTGGEDYRDGRRSSSRQRMLRPSSSQRSRSPGNYSGQVPRSRTPDDLDEYEVRSMKSR
eukprot:TRINITY_DN6067_c0_g1_i11.p1 TRINITY_DN6067_c0_g1~~TRINITY_DN6067_c0_g1_i11.p1  ORF type:complete len:682 (-),score=99.49 TRINITY_DN6067_c0_g1_i11:632-2542(-)